jgi:uncharacterized protein YjiS (DUF1127 family)
MKTPMSCNPVNRITPAASRSRAGWIATLMDRCLDWRERMQQRRDLGGLSMHMLKDIGLSGADVEMELRKRPWQI